MDGLSIEALDWWRDSFSSSEDRNLALAMCPADHRSAQKIVALDYWVMQQLLAAHPDLDEDGDA